MDVPTYCHRRVHLHDVAFFDEELAGFVAEFADGGFRDGTAGAEGGNPSKTNTISADLPSCRVIRIW